MMNKLKIYPRSKDRETVYLKNVVTDPGIIVGDYTMYDDFADEPTGFQLWQRKMFRLIQFLLCLQ